jgi:chemotaxis family two-component system sensor kinase Cph1
MGIGLYLVQEVARAHGGRVLVDSRPGVGSEFRFELPRM